jgi:hypothetical protein
MRIAPCSVRGGLSTLQWIIEVTMELHVPSEQDQLGVGRCKGCLEIFLLLTSFPCASRAARESADLPWHTSSSPLLTTSLISEVIFTCSTCVPCAVPNALLSAGFHIIHAMVHIRYTKCQPDGSMVATAFAQWYPNTLKLKHQSVSPMKYPYPSLCLCSPSAQPSASPAPL